MEAIFSYWIPRRTSRGYDIILYNVQSVSAFRSGAAIGNPPFVFVASAACSRQVSNFDGNCDIFRKFLSFEVDK